MNCEPTGQEPADVCWPRPSVSPQLSPVEKEEEEPIVAPPTSPVHVEAGDAPLAAPEPAPEATPSCPQDDSGKNHEPHLGPMRRRSEEHTSELQSQR